MLPRRASRSSHPPPSPPNSQTASATRPLIPTVSRRHPYDRGYPACQRRKRPWATASFPRRPSWPGRPRRLSSGRTSNSNGSRNGSRSRARNPSSCPSRRATSALFLFGVGTRGTYPPRRAWLVCLRRRLDHAPRGRGQGRARGRMGAATGWWMIRLSRGGFSLLLLVVVVVAAAVPWAR